MYRFLVVRLVVGGICILSAGYGSTATQPYYEGEAEDVGEVLTLNETITVPCGRFEGCLMIEETTQLARDVIEHKYYSSGLGHALPLDIKDSATHYELIAVEDG